MILLNLLHGDYVVHDFLKIISSKIKVIAWLEIELAYFETVVQYFSHFTTRKTTISQPSPAFRLPWQS